MTSRWRYPQAIPVLLGLCLVMFGCRDRTAVLIEQLASPDLQTRREAARVLGEMGPEAQRAIPALTAALGQDDLVVRRLAIHALGTQGSAAHSAVPVLTRTLEDRDISLQLAAAFAMQKIAPDNHAFVPVLTRAMQTGEGGVIVAVGKLGPGAAWAVPTLVHLLSDSRPGVRRLAADALGALGPAAREAKAALETARHDPDDRVRESVHTALALLQNGAKSE